METINGCIGLGAQQTDFLLCDADGNLPELFKQDEKIYEYNQGNSKDCTLYSAIGAVSDLYNYEFSTSEIAEIVNKSYTMGRVRGEGWYVQSAVKCVAQWWNVHHKELGRVAYYTVSLADDKLVDKILSLNYTLCSGFQGNSSYQSDYKKDGKLDGYSFGAKTYGHAVSWIKRDGKRFIKDNYKGRVANGISNNIYQVIPSCSQEVNGGTYYSNAYLFTKVSEDNYEEVKRLNEFRTKVNNSIENNSELWHLTNDKSFRDFLHDINNRLRLKLDDINLELKRNS